MTERNPDWVRCPICLRFYGFVNCRLTYKFKDGTQRDICLTCKVEENRLKKLSTTPEKEP